MTTSLLQAAQAQLDELGACDVRLRFKLESFAVPRSQLESDVAGLLQQYFNGAREKKDELPSEGTKLGRAGSFTGKTMLH